MQVKVKNSLELKRYVSQNISSYHLIIPGTLLLLLKITSVFWLNLKFVLSQALLYLFIIDKLL